MLLTEYNEKEAMELFKEDGREEGREETLLSTIKTVMGKLNYTAEKAMDFLDIPKDEQGKYILMMEQGDAAYQPE